MRKFEFTTDCKPCPFCGVLNPSIEDHKIRDHYEFVIFCENCGAVGPSGLGQADAIAMWNLRREYNPNHPNNVMRLPTEKLT